MIFFSETGSLTRVEGREVSRLKVEEVVGETLAIHSL